MRIAASLENHVRPHRLGRVTAAGTGFLLRRNPDTVRAPDVAFVRHDRVIDVDGYFPSAPDLAIEVVSPDDTYSDVIETVCDWLRSGVRMVVLVDLKKCASVHRPMTEAKRLTVDDTIGGEDVVEGWRMQMRELFGE